jgi:hypothetical protein
LCHFGLATLFLLLETSVLSKHFQSLESDHLTSPIVHFNIFIDEPQTNKITMGFMKKIKSSSSVVGGSKRKLKGKSSQLSKSVPALSLDKLDLDGAVIKRRSLATGSFSAQGLICIVPSPIDFSSTPRSQNTCEESIGSLSDDERMDDSKLSPKKLIDAATKLSTKLEAAVISHIPTMFIRTADLPTMRKSEHERQSFFEDDEDQWQDHFHKSSSRPPLSSIELDENERWIALDDGNGNSAPLADAAMSALVQTGMDAAMDQGMWTANGPTAKILKVGDWDQTAFAPLGNAKSTPSPHPKGSKGENDVLVWSGSFSHQFYGCDLPAIRCEAIVNMSPKALANLLIDSSRVKEYNKMSIGRDDILVFNQSEKCVTKVVVGKSKPPMLGKILQLKTLLHMQELPGGGDVGGYIVVSRAVAHADESEADQDPKVIHSEMLMGVNIIRAVEGEPDRCILINLNHLRSPMIPMMMAKRLGLSAAVNFINDIRALC